MTFLVEPVAVVTGAFLRGGYEPAGRKMKSNKNRTHILKEDMGPVALQIFVGHSEKHICPINCF